MPFREVKLQLLRRVGLHGGRDPIPPPVPGAGRLRGTLRAKHTGLELDAVRGTAKAGDLIEGRSSPDRFVES